jgi:signal transduction histidine kinase
MTSIAPRRTLGVAEDGKPVAHPDPLMDLLAGVAHELRAPLATLNAAAEMIEAATDAEQRQQFAGMVSRQAGRLSTLLEGVLTAYGGVAAGRVSSRRDVIDLESFVSRVCADQRGLFPDHLFEVEVPETVRLACDAALLEAALVNLTANAAKHAPRGSAIRVGGERAGEQVMLTVCDDGPGVPAAVRRGLFRAGTRGTTDLPGYGLGLYVAKRLCDAMGARIELEESGPGEGAHFVITLPA